jgi:hypothetical protein
MTGESLRNPGPELAEGRPTATAPFEPLEFELCVFVILAYAGIHSLQLVSMDSRLRGNDGQWQSPTVANCFSFFAYLASSR